MALSKPKILCLHGFTSNGAVHRHQVRRVTSALSEYQFIFPDGPHEVDIALKFDLSKPHNQLWTNLVHSQSSSGHRAWWFAKDREDGTHGEFAGIETSFEFIGKLAQQEGPFHAIWGFSQGACFAGMLCALLQDNLADHPWRKYFQSTTIAPQAGIMFSGFKARYPQYNGIYAQGLSLPTMHIMGVEDDDVTNDRSEELIQICKDSIVLKHNGGHNIPKAEEDQARIIEFVKNHVFLNDGKPVQSSL